MVGNADLTGKHGISFDGDAAGEAGLSRDHHIFPDLAVVTDVDKIVDFRSPADAGYVERAPVDGGVGADFYIVADLQTAHLGKLLVTAGGGIADISEAVASQHGAGVEENPVTDADTGVESHIREELAVIADARVLADNAAGADSSVASNHGIPADDDSFSNGYALSQPGLGMDDRTAMDCRLLRRIPAQKRGRLGKRQSRMSADQERFRTGIAKRKLARYDDGGRGPQCLRQKFLIFEENQVAGPSLLKARDCGYSDAAIADQAGFKKAGQLSGGVSWQ